MHCDGLAALRPGSAPSQARRKSWMPWIRALASSRLQKLGKTFATKGFAHVTFCNLVIRVKPGRTFRKPSNSCAKHDLTISVSRSLILCQEQNSFSVYMANSD